MELRLYIFKNRITQKEFAKKIDCSVVHLGKVVNGLITPSANLAIKIVHATNYEVTFEDLFQDKINELKNKNINDVHLYIDEP
jgi:transcriptional regulator with XRE-family HTH domain